MRIDLGRLFIAALLAAACAGRGSAQPMAGDQQGGAGVGGGGDCRSDVSQYCGRARAMGPDEIQKCLALHVNQISKQCRDHLVQGNLIEAEVAAPAGPSAAICQPDVMRLCSKISLSDQPEAAYECLVVHLKELSPGCRPQAQGAHNHAEQNALTRVDLDCRAEAAQFCKGTPRSQSYPFLDCLLGKEKKAGKTCQAALDAAKPFLEDLKAKYKGPRRSWWHWW